MRIREILFHNFRSFRGERRISFVDPLTDTVWQPRQRNYIFPLRKLGMMCWALIFIFALTHRQNWKI